MGTARKKKPKSEPKLPRYMLRHATNDIAGVPCGRYWIDTQRMPDGSVRLHAYGDTGTVYDNGARASLHWEIDVEKPTLEECVAALRMLSDLQVPKGADIGAAALALGVEDAGVAA